MTGWKVQRPGETAGPAKIPVQCVIDGGSDFELTGLGHEAIPLVDLFDDADRGDRMW